MARRHKKKAKPVRKPIAKKRITKKVVSRKPPKKVVAKRRFKNARVKTIVRTTKFRKSTTRSVTSRRPKTNVRKRRVKRKSYKSNTRSSRKSQSIVRQKQGSRRRHRKHPHKKLLLKSKGKFRGKSGRFVKRKQWEKENLPKQKRGKGKGWRDVKRWITPQNRYEYRQFVLTNFRKPTIDSILDHVFGEKKPHPILMYLHMAYTNENGERKSVGTHFQPFEYDAVDDLIEELKRKLEEYQEKMGEESDDGEAVKIKPNFLELVITYSIVKQKE